MEQSDRASKRSRIGLNAVNFFLAEMAGVIGPFFAVYLQQKNWSYSQIGIATAAAGLGTLVAQTPAGQICDRVENRKALLALTSVILGGGFAILPFVSGSFPLVVLILFITGVVSSFFVPLLATLCLSLVGNRYFPKVMGENQSWNHAGNIAAALLALLIVKLIGVEAIFFVTGAVSFLAVVSLSLIESKEIHTNVKKNDEQDVFSNLWDFFSHSPTRILLISVALFHFANAPILPLVGLYIKHLGGADDKVAWTVLVAQAVMIPMALLAGKYCEGMGRKPVFAFAFLILPIRIVLYSFTTNPTLLLAIQTLDGIGAGIYGVVIALICHDLTRGRSGFNLLMGLAQTALAIGGFLGPLVQGFLTQSLGFPGTFLVFAGVAALGCTIFIVYFPETKEA